MQLALVACHTADLRCRKCGAWHGQVITGVLVGPNREARLIPARCPKCGLADCAGPYRHVDIGMKGTGKTLEALLIMAYGAGRYGQVKVRPNFVVIGANITEAGDRLGVLKEFLSRPQHEFVFGQATVPLKKTQGATIRCRRWGWKGMAVVRGYGVLGMPNGLHVHKVLWDDGCTLRTSLIFPKLGKKVTTKFFSTADQGTLPWTTVDVLGNVCVAGDLNSQLRKLAKAYPDQYTLLEAFAGGPLSNPPFHSPWPEMWPPDRLRHFYRNSEREYTRTFMGKPFMPGEVAFRRFRYWMRHDAPGMDDRQTAEWVNRHGVSVLREDPRTMPMVRMMGVDPGWTGPESDRLDNMSKSGIVILALDLATHWLYTLQAMEEFIPVDKHRETILDLARHWNCAEVAIEAGKAQTEFLDWLRRQGLIVHVYGVTSKEFGGSKEMRKYGVADASNDGRLMLEGTLDFHARGAGGGPAVLRVHPSQQRLEEAAQMYPAASSDVLDAWEIATRMAWAVYGAYPAVPSGEAGPVEDLSRLPAWRRRLAAGFGGQEPDPVEVSYPWATQEDHYLIEQN